MALPVGVDMQMLLAGRGLWEAAVGSCALSKVGTGALAGHLAPQNAHALPRPASGLACVNATLALRGDAQRPALALSPSNSYLPGRGDTMITKVVLPG